VVRLAGWLDSAAANARKIRGSSRPLIRAIDGSTRS
jgi:hypothetical protein